MLICLETEMDDRYNHPACADVFRKTYHPALRDLYAVLTCIEAWHNENKGNLPLPLIRDFKKAHEAWCRAFDELEMVVKLVE